MDKTLVDSGSPLFRFSLRITDAYITLMITLFPLFFGADGYNRIGTVKLYLFCALTLLWLFLLGAAALARLFREKTGKPGTVEYLCAAFMAASTVSFLCSPDAAICSPTSGGLMEYLLYGGMVVGVYRFGQAKKRYLWLAAAAYLVCCTVAVLQLLGHNPFSFYPAAFRYHDPVIQEVCPFLGTIGNVDTLSAYHCLMIPLLLSAVWCGKRKRRFLLIVPALLGAVCAAAVGVASGLLAFCCLGAVLACVAAAKWYTGRKVNAPPVWRAALLLGLLLAAVTLAAVYFLPVSGGTVYELKMILHGRIEDRFGSSRIRIWKAAVREFFEHPVIGVGPDCLYFHLDIRFERFSEVLQDLRVTYATNAHNEYLELLCTVGLLGFIPFAVLMGGTWVKALRSGETQQKNLLLPALLCYLTQAFFNIGSHVITPIFVIFWGLILGRFWKQREK